jgi:RNA-binding protein
MIDKDKLYQLRSRSRTLEPIIRIGKNGLTEGMFKEIVIHLKKKRLIKIKVLKNALSYVTIDDLIQNIISKCGCVLIDKIGLTFVLYKIKN